MKEELKKYQDYEDLINKYNYAINVLSFDANTVCPTDDKAYSNSVQDFLSAKVLDITTSPDYLANIDYLFEHKNELDELTRFQIEREHKELAKIKLIPKDKLLAHYENVSRCGLEWEKARTTLDYSEFEKELEELVEFNKYYASTIDPSKSNFDVILDEMEEGLTSEVYDKFFKLLEEKVLPIVKVKINEHKKYKESIKDVKFSIVKQKELTKRICDLMGYTHDKGYIGETIHPFTSGFNSNDVRTTTAYNESLLFSNLYSVMHEVGHALYELGNDKAIKNRYVFGGASCALHESQSRFYENYLGRRRSFVHFLYPMLKEIFSEELKDYTEDDIYYYINDVSNGLIRTEADELTYPFHIMVRYKVERDLFENNLPVSEISNKFNEYFKEYFGTCATNKKEGCYQDVHWSSGFGYFPTYALGSAYGASVLKYMARDIDIDEELSRGDFTKINAWLKDHVHKYGASKKNSEVLKLMTGKDEFDPNDYVEYLINKFN